MARQREVNEMLDVQINYFAVLVAAAINMILGFLWYGPIFGKQWMEGMGYKSVNDVDKTNMNRIYAFNMLGALVLAFVLALFVNYTDASTIDQGAIIGFWAWLGFVIPTSLTTFLFEGRNRVVFSLNIGYYLASLIVMGALLAVWR